LIYTKRATTIFLTTYFIRPPKTTKVMLPSREVIPVITDIIVWANTKTIKSKRAPFTILDEFQARKP